MNNFSQKIQQFFKESPEYGGLIPMAVGLLLIVGAVCNWSWVLEGDGRVFNLAWLSNFMGRTFARITCGIFGIILIALGIIWFIIYSV